MEGQAQRLPEHLDGDNNEKFVSGFSTLLVATIQEAKDRISQIEYIFCEQLFPDFQSRTKSLRAVYTDAHKASEDLWKKKEADLLSRLHLSQDQTLSLKLENEKMAEKLEDEAESKLLLEKKISNLEAEFEKAACEGAKQRAAEAAEGKRLQKEMMDGAVREHENEKRAKEEKERGEFLKKLELKDGELERVKKRGNDLVVAYKQLKSQYNFLCRQKGLHPIHDNEDINREGSRSSQEGAREDEIKDGWVARQPDPDPVNKTVLVCKTKRTATHWRETRSWDVTEGPDPHDDFLNTPLEAARQNRQRVDPDPSELGGSSLVNERGVTGAGSGSSGGQKRQGPPRGADGTGGFKHVETVRKKTERERLKGVECDQCKKFYETVGAGGPGCDHHLDDVSRHRYRYAPPSTPDGFWNIGFDSEI